MAEKLKDMFFTQESLGMFSDAIKQHYPAFDKKRFLDLIHDKEWGNREIKQKMRHTTVCLFETLPKDFSKAIKILLKAAPDLSGFEAMSLSDFVELYGMDDWDLSLTALKVFTQSASAEFAIRPFLDNDQNRIIAYLLNLADDKNEKVRRLASEGCRPRLPWAMALPKLKKDPRPILPILEKLKNDPSADVRRSVANNINDISKDNEGVALELCEKWFGRTKDTDAIVKHACRSLLKAGNKRALVLFGFSDPGNLKVKKLKLGKKTIQLGHEQLFSFILDVNEKKARKVRLEYGVYFIKANGKTSRKVFQITENIFEPGEHEFSRKHRFVDMTTRKHHPGPHEISIIVNGVEKVKNQFELQSNH